LRDPGSSWIWLMLAGFGGGVTGSVAGLASLVSYPALLAVGLAPIAANVTNTVALVLSAAGSVWGFRPELSELRGTARRLAPLALAGGLSGSLLLLTTPSSYFVKVVPLLLTGASLAILAPRRQKAPSSARPRKAQLVGVPAYLIGLYGGYFGAGAGIVMLALLLASTALSLTKCTALRNLLMGLTNLVAAGIFTFFGPVDWLAALPLAAGFLAGGRLGPALVRRAPQWPLRVLIAAAGVAVAARLAASAY
jgi:uncharacterized membrane protein YfcA